MKKIFSIIAILMMAITGAKATVITWNNNDIYSDGKSFTKDGITMNVTGVLCDFDAKNFSGGTFTSTVGNFTKIEVTAMQLTNMGTGWTVSGGKATWTGTPSSTVNFGGSNLMDGIWGMGKGVTMVFTIEDPTVAVTGVTLDPTTASLTVGETVTLTPTVAPDDATDKTVTWTSSDESVATVADGVVTAQGAGTATITVTTTDGSKTATCEVTVTAPQPTYTITMAEGTVDVDKWTISPTEAAEGQTVTVTYSGTKKVKSIKAVKKAPAVIDLSTLTADYVAKDGDVLTGTLDVEKYPVKISIADGATVTLDGVTINGVHREERDDAGGYIPYYEWAGITCKGSATIILADGSENTVRGFYHTYPGIAAPGENKTLTIRGGSAGTGSLYVSSNEGDGYGDGISGSGNIVIEGGNVTAVGGMGYNAGIGNCQSVTISGGTVTASCISGPGIGAGAYQTCGDILISGGTVTVTSAGYGSAGIGSAVEGNCGNITITDGVTKVVVNKGNDAPYSIGKGIEGGSCGTITIGGTEGAISESPYTYEPGAATARALSEATSEDIGKIVGTDGNIYDTQDDATAAGTTAVAMIAYVGSDTDNDTYTNGLAIALSNESGYMVWETAKTTCEGKTAVRGASWCLPSQNQWNTMFNANGGYNGLNTIINSAGGTALQWSGFYWSSTVYDGDNAYYVYLDEDGAWFSYYGKNYNYLVRACLTF